MKEYLPVVTKPIPYLSIIGCSYTGSTLLALLLNNHPRIATISEVGQVRGVPVEEYQCSCGARLLQCPFFLKVEQRINELGSSFSLRHWETEFHLSRHRWLDIPLVRPLRNVMIENIRDQIVPFWPGYRQTIATIGRRIVHFAQAVLDITGKQVFADAKKDSMRVKFLGNMNALDLRVIHLVRDVRGGVASIMKYKGQDAEWATRMWYHANMNADRAKRFVPPRRWMQIRYEELSERPQDTLNRISDFLEIPTAPIPKDLYAAEHHILGNKMRLNGSGIIKKDDTWQNQLSERDLKVIARIGGKANHYFGHQWP